MSVLAIWSILLSSYLAGASRSKIQKALEIVTGYFTGGQPVNLERTVPDMNTNMA